MNFGEELYQALNNANERKHDILNNLLECHRIIVSKTLLPPLYPDQSSNFLISPLGEIKVKIGLHHYDHDFTKLFELAKYEIDHYNEKKLSSCFTNIITNSDIKQQFSLTLNDTMVYFEAIHIFSKNPLELAFIYVL
jgi:hypothetical protein